jgi:aminoglycoside phosphotransferase (APT) family kinase protein
VSADARAPAPAAEPPDVGGNVLIEDDRVALIDWDESRVDVPAFDFAHLPDDVPVPVQGDRQALVTAGVAWEAATCWIAEPGHAARRLAELRDRVRG